MTLNEWANAASASIEHLNDATFVNLPYDASLEEILALYKLSDFIVSSVSGLVIWFVPRNPQNQA